MSGRFDTETRSMPRKIDQGIWRLLSNQPLLWTLRARNNKAADYNFGCKVATVERWAEVGSGFIGIGGRGTGQPNELT